MDNSIYKDKLIALVVWNVDKDDDVHVYLGRLVADSTGFTFKNESKGWHVPLQAEKLEGLKKVTDDLKSTLLNADFYINVTISDVINDQGDYILSSRRVSRLGDSVGKQYFIHANTKDQSQFIPLFT